MDLMQAAILGIVQGLTEFLPISSSAHLVLVPFYMGWNVSPEANIAYDILVHFGTLVAVLAFFFDDVKKLAIAFSKSIVERRVGDDPYRRLAWFLIIGTLPTAIVYILVKDLLFVTLNSPMLVGGFLLLTGTLLVSSELLGKREVEARQLGIRDVIFIGFAQGLAILPGISRSGSTIAAGLFRGLSREEAARFSFLLSIPVILAAAFQQIAELAGTPVGDGETGMLIAGFVSAAVSGYFVIKYFLEYLRKHSLYVFALYCYVLGTLTLAVTILK